MELPKNITQIGETNPHCKIYVEDYVISYIRHLNRQAQEKGLAAALYGTRKEEGEVAYLFLYGACRMHFLQRECRHLSQAVCQEAEKQRRKYFPGHTFLGYCLLDGEMIEGFHICEQNVCRYVAGYAQFYEKNDCMLSLMLSERQEEAKPEEVGQEKYDMVRKRQEERRALAGEKAGQAFRRHLSVRPKLPATRLGSMKLAAAAAFVLLAVAGFASMGGGQLERWRLAAGELAAGMAKKRLPDTAAVANGPAQAGTVVAEDKLEDAIRKENDAAGGGFGSAQEGTVPSAPDSAAAAPEPEPTALPEPEPTALPVPEPTALPVPEPTAPPAPEPTVAPAPEPTVAPPAQEPASAQPAVETVSYTVRRGDTLIGICLRQYGSKARMSEVCALNNIRNPDDIKVGEKISLPK